MLCGESNKMRFVANLSTTTKITFFAVFCCQSLYMKSIDISPHFLSWGGNGINFPSFFLFEAFDSWYLAEESTHFLMLFRNDGQNKCLLIRFNIFFSPRCRSKSDSWLSFINNSLVFPEECKVSSRTKVFFFVSRKVL